MIPTKSFPALAALALALSLGAVIVACGGKTGSGAVEYSVSAQKNYDKGLKELERKDWVAASKYFGFIKSRFPYSKYAVLAELRLADAEFGAEQYLEAIDSYRLFIKFHPTHEMVANGYAAFRIGEAYYKQLPGDFWLFPPSYEKDQSSTEDAANELKSFLDKYPDSPYRDEGQGDPRQGRQAARRSRVVRRALLLGSRQADGHRAPAAPPARALPRRRLRRGGAVAARPRVRRGRDAGPRARRVDRARREVPAQRRAPATPRTALAPASK